MVVDTALGYFGKDFIIDFAELVAVALLEMGEEFKEVLTDLAFDGAAADHLLLKRGKIYMLCSLWIRMTKPRYSKTQQTEIAQQRIKILFSEAGAVFAARPDDAHRYVALARKIAMKVKTKIPVELKRRYCKHCYHYLLSGVNARVRTRDGKVVISCLDCKKFLRVPMGTKKLQKS